VLDSWFLQLRLIAEADKAATVPLTKDEIKRSLGKSANGYARHGDIRDVDIVPIHTEIESWHPRRPMCTTPTFDSIC